VANADPPSRATRLLRFGAAAVVLILVAGVGWAAAGGIFDATGVVTPTATPGGTPRGSGEGTATSPPAPTPTPRPPTGGTELYGYLPYWQMSDRMAAYLDRVPVSTLALFSVSAGSSGGIRHGEIGYQRITGDRGRGLIADAHARGQRVELVFTSFGYKLNTRLFADDPQAEARRARAARELLELAADLGVDGLNVDVERIEGEVSDGYGAFLAALDAGLASVNPKATLSVATTASHTGATLAATAVARGADRVFLMGYDYHWSGSAAGASSPVHNRDTGIDLNWSIAEYVNLGVPRDRILLGLPLYGMSWPVAGPGRAAEVLGKGSVWIPTKHADTLLAKGFSPAFDAYEIADYFVTLDGDGWRATYYDSPRSLRPKLALARSQGLAGAGFWALGYEYGLPGYLDLMRDFLAGRVAPAD